MAKCGLCSTSVTRLHQYISKNKTSYICTACNSNLSNGKLLNRSTSLSRLGLLLKLAYISANLATARGKKMLKSLVGGL